MALRKTKKLFVIIMSIFMLVIMTLTSLYTNGFTFDIVSIVAILIGWLVGTGVLILLIRYIIPSKKQS